MKKTGERYTAARAALLGMLSQQPSAISTSRLFPNYPALGSVCPDTGALRNVLAAAGITGPDGTPLGEAAISGICGGVGFLYAVFEYKGWPPILTITCRYDSMPETFIATGLANLGVPVTVKESTSTTAAAKSLDAVLSKQMACLCVVDRVGLEDGPANLAGMIPTIVAVCGVDGDDLLIDHGMLVPFCIPKGQFAKARAMYKKGKHRMITFDGPHKVDLSKAARSVTSKTAERYKNAPFKGFASNFGFAGMEKWQRLLSDRNDPKGWPKLFPEGKLAYLGLRRAYDGLENEFTAPAAGRPFFAEFLDAASEWTGDKRYLVAAKAYRDAGQEWSDASRIIANCGDRFVEAGCRLGDSARELADESPNGAAKGDMEHETLAAKCTMTHERACGLFDELAVQISRAIDAERNAVDALSKCGSR
jgi:hypothetical protein